MKKSILIIIFLVFITSYNSYCQTIPEVSVIGSPYKEFEYKCYSTESNYSGIEFPYFTISNLEYNENYFYLLSIYDPRAFGEITYHTSPGFLTWGDYYRWVEQYTTTSEVDVAFSGSYDNLQLNSSQLLRFVIGKGISGDTAIIETHVVTPMYISGPSLICSNPVSFYLEEMPEYSSATWVINQGSVTRGSGNGTTATVNNLSTGQAEVIFTVDFECGLRDLDFRKEFHFGPYSSSDYPITGPSSSQCLSYVYYSIPSLVGVTSINWTWPSSWTYISGQNTESLALRTGLSGTSGIVAVGVNNDCGQSGSYATKYTSVYGNCGYSLIITPNPSSEDVNVTILEPRLEEVDSLSNKQIIESLPNRPADFQFILTDKLGNVFSSFNKNTKSFTISVQNLKNGNYILTGTDGIVKFSSPLIVMH